MWTFFIYIFKKLKTKTMGKDSNIMLRVLWSKWAAFRNVVWTTVEFKSESRKKRKTILKNPEKCACWGIEINIMGKIENRKNKRYHGAFVGVETVELFEESILNV